MTRPINEQATQEQENPPVRDLTLVGFSLGGVAGLGVGLELEPLVTGVPSELFLAATFAGGMALGTALATVAQRFMRRDTA